MRNKLYFYIILYLGLLTGCSSGQLKTIEMKDEEAIIVARAFINNGGEKIDTKWNFLWDERLWGSNSV